MSCKRIASLALALAVSAGLASNALADGRQSVKLDLSSDTTLGGTKVPPGQYKLAWTASGDDADVKLMQGKKVVATSKAKVVGRDKAASDDEVVQRKNGSGYAVSEIRVRGEKNVLVLQAS
jgi:hypothetical protein